MDMKTATGIACPNIALIKYWGNIDDSLRIPANGSISMNLDGLSTTTDVAFSEDLNADRLSIDGKEIKGNPLTRVSTFLDHVRKLAGIEVFAEVRSNNNFPMDAGIASSASAFAALAVAASSAAGLSLSNEELSRLARRGSGSACRSIPTGYVEWTPGEDDQSSHAVSIAPPHHWEISDCIAIINTDSKMIGSTEGHQLANTSPIQSARVTDAPRRIKICRKAILDQDFDELTRIVELDSNLMHAVMMTSTPPLHYWLPGTIAVMNAVRKMRESGISACYTIDAGPNVHVICPGNQEGDVTEVLAEVPEIVDVIIAHPGHGAEII